MKAITAIIEKGERVAAAALGQKKQEILGDIRSIKAEIGKELDEIKAMNDDIQLRICWKRELYTKADDLKKRLDQLKNQRGPASITQYKTLKAQLVEVQKACIEIKQQINDRIFAVTTARERVATLKQEKEKLKAVINNQARLSEAVAAGKRITVH